MNVDYIHITPAKTVEQLDHLKDRLGEVGTVAVILEDRLESLDLLALASAIGNSNAALVAAWGDQSEEFHDLVDETSIRWRTSGPLTTWDVDENLDDFIWNVATVYRSALEIPDQERPNLICFVSNEQLTPHAVSSGIEEMRRITLPPS